MDLGGFLARNSRRHPQKEALIFEERRYTYAELNAAVNSLANGMKELGICKGDKVSIIMQNSDKFVIAYYAILKLGAVVVPLNYRLAAPEVEYVLNDSDSVAVILDPEYKGLLRKIRANVPLLRWCVSTGEEEDFLNWDTFLANYVDKEPNVQVDLYDDCQILYTSGTTGKPKGALFDHLRIMTVGHNVISTVSLTHHDRIINVAPLYHSAQLDLFLLPGFYVGATHVILKEFHPIKALEAIQAEKISVFFGVPTMFNFMIQMPNFDQYDLKSLRCCLYGAAPMAAETVKRVIEKFGTDQFYNLCGLTEMGPGGIYLPPEEQIPRAGAAGKSILNTEARLVNDQGLDVLPGQVGELIVRGETMMKEYYKKPEATAETIVDGWLHTGDMGVMDEEGFITLVDRKKDMIITGGENVYSSEVEQAVFAHPGVLDAAVIGVPHPVWGETVTAVVVPREGQSLDEGELIAFLKERLADYKVPRIVRFTDALPRNASGKVMKTELRSTYRDAVKEAGL